MKKSARFDKSLDSHLVWRAEGANRLRSNRDHLVIFQLGPAHRDKALRELRRLKREQKSVRVRLTRSEKISLDAASL